MLQQEYFLQSTRKPGEIHRGLLQLAVGARFTKLTVAVAYATRIGCDSLNKSFTSNVHRWAQMRKRWIVSIDHGTTEPDALAFLAALPNSEVRVANAEAVLNANLRAKVRFHHKLYFFEGRNPNETVGLFQGSANLTLSGLTVNNEQASSILIIPPAGQIETEHIASLRDQATLLEETYLAGTVLDEELLERYRGVWRPSRSSEDRTRLVRIIRSPAPYLPLIKAVALATAPSFWVEIRYVVPNLGQGVPGNQIDLQRGSRVYFGFPARDVPRNTVLGTVQIRYGNILSECHMRFGNNQMDKLNLPLPSTHGPRTYRNQTLLFERREDGTFDLHVGTPAEIAAWKVRSRNNGTLYRMQGGREYGVF